METVTASSPAALSFIFRAFLPSGANSIEDYKTFGSTGIGTTIDKKVFATVWRSSKTQITFNGLKINIPTVTTALKYLTKARFNISIKSELPLGCGFGISGAATLATIFAINKLLNLKKSKTNLYKIAHFAEIKEKTGLGTIATQITGGFLIKKAPGIPPVFKRLNFTSTKIFAIVVKPLKTSAILKDKNKIGKINSEADKILGEIGKKNKITIEDIINISYKFCLANNFLNPEISKLIEEIRLSGGKATMAILGHTVLSNIKPLKVKYPVFELYALEDKPKIIQ